MNMAGIPSSISLSKETSLLASRVSNPAGVPTTCAVLGADPIDASPLAHSGCAAVTRLYHAQCSPQPGCRG